MSTNIKKTPWINDGTAGFFEYQIDVPLLGDIHLVAREKEHLQNYVTEELHHRTVDMITTYITEKTYKEYWEEYTDEQRNEISCFDLINERISNQDLRQEVYNTLLNAKEIIDENTVVDELGCEYVAYDEEDIKDLQAFLADYPSTEQGELEEIYRHQQSESLKYGLFKQGIRAAQDAVFNYENNLAISELLVQNYEKELAMEEQLISNSEMIVELYEAINSEVEGK